MALAFDTSGHTYTGAGTTTTVNLAAGTTECIALMGVEYGTSGSHDFSNLTAGGSSVGITQIGSTQAVAGRSVRLYYLLNPSTSATDYVLTTNNTNDDQDLYVWTLSGALQSGQPDSSANVSAVSINGGADITLSTTVVASNCWLVSIITDPAGAFIESTGTKQREAAGTDESVVGDSNGVVSTGSQSMKWTNSSGGALTVGGIIASIAPSVVVTPPSITTTAAAGPLHVSIRSTVVNAILRSAVPSMNISVTPSSPHTKIN